MAKFRPHAAILGDVRGLPSFRLFDLGSVPVRLPVLAPLVAAAFLVTTPEYARPPVLGSLLLFLLVLGAGTLAHGAGRALAARREGLPVEGIHLWPLAARVDHGGPGSRASGLRVAAGGFTALLLLALAAGTALGVAGAAPGLPRLVPSTDPLLTCWNVLGALVLLHLLPGIPFDGGVALEACLLRPLGAERARMVVLGTGTLVGAGLLLGGLQGEDVLLAAVGAWGLHAVLRGWRGMRDLGVEGENVLGIHDFSRGRRDGAAAPSFAPVPPEPPAPRRPTAPAETPRERLDRLLGRISAEGIGSLSDEERVFLNEESRRLRDRKGSPTRP
jgi:Zn-dependent protease